VTCLYKTNIAKYYAIQVRDMPIFALLGLLTAKLRGVKFIYWMSYPMPEAHIILAGHRKLSEGLLKYFIPWFKGHIGHFLLYRVVLPRADHVFVQSDWMKENLIKQGICSNKMSSVPMGIDLEALQHNNIAPLNDSHYAGKRVLVYLGTFGAPRKIEVLFEMLSILKDQFPNVLLVMVGDDVDSQAQRHWLRKKADELCINSHLLWTGWLPRDEAWRYVCSAEVALSPIPRGYLLDCSSPTKLPEYFALGVPVVCNDNPDQQQVIRQSGAGICVPYTAKDFADATVKILLLDETDRNEMISKGKDYVTQYRDYKKISYDVAKTYKEISLSHG
jgi:glycosyltransferase involved in cell wall biosynthesis